MNAPCPVVLVAIHARPGPESVPLGAASVAAALKADSRLRDRIAVRLVEATLIPGDGAGSAFDAAGLAARILAFQPGVVGLSVYLWNRPAMAVLARELRRLCPRLVLVAGGPEAGADPGGLRRELSLDRVVAGEGEAALAGLLCEVLGIGQAGTAANPSPEPAASGEAGAAPGTAAIPGAAAAAVEPAAARDAHLASPWLDGTLDPAAYEGLLWELTRGCPFGCTFCYESRGRRGVFPLPEARLDREMELFAATGVRQVFVLDPTFNVDRRRAVRLLGKLAAGARRGWNCHFRFEARAELLDRAQAEAFANLDCSVQIGLQSAHPAVLGRLGRSLDRADFARKIGLLNQAGVVFGFDLIWGLPGDSLAGFRSSLSWALSLQPNHLDVFGLSVLPGTELADQAAGFGLAWQAEPPYAVVSGPGFPPADLARAAALARAVDIFYNRGRAVPWFAAVTRACRMDAARFLEGYADFLDRRAGEQAPAPGSPHGRIEASQLEWLAEVCGAGGTGGAGGSPGAGGKKGAGGSSGPGGPLPSGQAMPVGLFPLIRDLVRLNGACARAYAEGESSQLELSWDPDSLQSPGVLDLRRFLDHVPRRACRVRVASRSGAVAVERVRVAGSTPGRRR